VDGGVDDPERAGNARPHDGDAGPPNGLGDGHDTLPCRLDEGGNARDQCYRNGDQKKLVHDVLLSLSTPA